MVAFDAAIFVVSCYTGNMRQVVRRIVHFFIFWKSARKTLTLDKDLDICHSPSQEIKIRHQVSYAVYNILF